MKNEMGNFYKILIIVCLIIYQPLLASAETVTGINKETGEVVIRELPSPWLVLGFALIVILPFFILAMIYFKFWKKNWEDLRSRQIPYKKLYLLLYCIAGGLGVAVYHFFIKKKLDNKSNQNKHNL